MSWFTGRFSMNKRGTGTILIVVAALLYCTKYLSAAIFASNSSSWGSDIFQNMLSYTGGDLGLFSLIALVAGIIYLVWEEGSAIHTRRKEKLSQLEDFMKK